MMVAIKVVRVYKSVLESLRDTIFIPSLDDKLCSAYRDARLEGRSDDDPIVAFKKTDSRVHGYYPMKVAMIEELIKAKGWRKIVLVAPAVQLPRAVAVFRAEGLDVTAAAAPFRSESTAMRAG